MRGLTGAADAYPRRLDLHLTGLDVWNGNLFVAQVVLSVESHCVHAAVCHMGRVS